LLIFFTTELGHRGANLASAKIKAIAFIASQVTRDTAMPNLSLPYPDNLLITSGKSPQALETELLFLLAVKLFELRRLSLGKAAEFCHMNKLQFM
jgi:hypothetical protein